MNRVELGRLCDPLRRILADVSVTGPEVPVVGLACDSRRVRPGELFVAGVGTREDALVHLPEALERGAGAVLAARRPELPDGIGFVGVTDVALAKGVLADTFYGHPSGRLRVVGITGTNGKTTTAHMLRAMLTMDGRPTGLVGTLGAWIGSEHEPLANTTPDAIELQHLLARMVDANLDGVVMEVSSHALVQHRAVGVDVDVGVFTNLSQDHLDYHGDMATYGAAKARLFEDLGPEATAVLNVDDDFGRTLADSTPARVVRYGFSGRPDVDVSAEVLRLDADGTAFRIDARESGLALTLETRLVGRHNVANAVAAAAAALALGLPPSAIRTGLSSMAAVPGRLQPVDCGQDFRVLVDYAHTPDALEKVLAQLRPLTRGRLAVVFGCGGDRDRGKRALMGRVAARLADDVYVTSDNPRSEDPTAIVDQILAGAGPTRVPGGSLTPLVDRREAIAAACAGARGGDIVLVAGKGHETTQVVGDRVIDFDDCEIAREVLWRL